MESRIKEISIYEESEDIEICNEMLRYGLESILKLILTNNLKYPLNHQNYNRIIKGMPKDYNLRATYLKNIQFPKIDWNYYFCILNKSYRFAQVFSGMDEEEEKLHKLLFKNKFTK